MLLPIHWQDDQKLQPVFARTDAANATTVSLSSAPGISQSSLEVPRCFSALGSQEQCFRGDAEYRSIPRPQSSGRSGLLGSVLLPTLLHGSWSRFGGLAVAATKSLGGVLLDLRARVPSAPARAASLCSGLRLGPAGKQSSN